MPINLAPLDTASRLLVEAELKVATGGGGRFQPTGFPDLGPALFRGADGANWLLVESSQSMANRLERVCWIDGDGETDRVGGYNEACKGIPYVLATDTDDKPLTASTLEAHRLSSPYIWDTQPIADDVKVPDPDDASKSINFAEYKRKNPKTEDQVLGGYLKRLFSLADNRLVPWKKVATGLLKIDPGCLLHGVWFSKDTFMGGKVRMTRVLSGYIEAKDPSTANFGFQKRDDVRSEKTEEGQSSKEGMGSVIGPKQHFTSAEVKAYFQIDLERLRSYGLPNEQVQSLVAWAIYKIRRVLVASRDGVADLRTECKFEVKQRKKDPKDPSDKPIMVEAIDCWLMDQETGNRNPFMLPIIDDDLKEAFKSLKTSAKQFTVRWIPKIEGKSELVDEVKETDFKLAGLEQKTKFTTEEKTKDRKKVKVTYFVVFGEWSQEDKVTLRKQNSEGKVKGVVEKAITAFEKNWEAKAQSRKADKSDGNDDADTTDDEQDGAN